MNKMKNLVFAVVAVAGMSGCASTRVADYAGVSAPQPVAEPAVSRPASFGSFGGYRYRRFTAVTGA
jgi:hypothetical protein